MTSKSTTRLTVSRRTTIKWLAASMAIAHAGCSSEVGEEIPPQTSNAALGTAATPTGVRYGTDPDLMNPAVPWSKTMTEAQLELATALADVIIPEDEHSPSAGSLGVADFIDEWISAPYHHQVSDRPYILNGLEWLEQQSLERYSSGFVAATEAQKTELIDRLAYPSDNSDELADQVSFFGRFRFLAVAAFYATDVGSKDVGYVGNVPIAGEYPGPSDEAMEHLAGVLEQLGLTLTA